MGYKTLLDGVKIAGLVIVASVALFFGLDSFRKNEDNLVIKKESKKEINPQSSTETLETGFEDGTTGSPIDAHESIRISQKLGPVDLPIQYEGGAPSDRYARIISDPTQTSTNNHVLHFWLKNAMIPTESSFKGRVQLNTSPNATELYQTHRMYLHPDIALYKTYPKENTWFTVQEFFMGAPWDWHKNAFRITLNIVKDAGVGKPLLFMVTGSTYNNNNGKWEPLWNQVNENYEVPIGEWLDVQIGYKQGDSSDGAFFVNIKKDGKYSSLLSVKNWTYNPKSPTPVPLTNYYPLKLYTSKTIIDHIRNNGGVAQIYWDDLKITGTVLSEI